MLRLNFGKKGFFEAMLGMFRGGYMLSVQGRGEEKIGSLDIEML